MTSGLATPAAIGHGLSSNWNWLLLLLLFVAALSAWPPARLTHREESGVQEPTRFDKRRIFFLRFSLALLFLRYAHVWSPWSEPEKQPQWLAWILAAFIFTRMPRHLQWWRPWMMGAIAFVSYLIGESGLVGLAIQSSALAGTWALQAHEDGRHLKLRRRSRRENNHNLALERERASWIAGQLGRAGLDPDTPDFSRVTQLIALHQNPPWVFGPNGPIGRVGRLENAAAVTAVIRELEDMVGITPNMSSTTILPPVTPPTGVPQQNGSQPAQTPSGSQGGQGGRQSRGGRTPRSGRS